MTDSLRWFLRKSGFTIEVDQLMDIGKVLVHAETQMELHVSIRSIICKSMAEQKIFDILFPLYLQGQESNDRPSSLAPSPNPLTLGGAGGALEGGGNSIDHLLASLGTMYKLAIRKFFLESPKKAADFAINRYVLPRNNSFEELLAKYTQVKNSVGEELDHIVPGHQLGKLFQDELAHSLNLVMEKLEHWRIVVPTFQSLEDRNFMDLEFSPELQRALWIFGRRIAVKQSYLLRASGQQFNFRQTIRVNLQNGGVPIELVRQKKKKKRPRILVLTDVSPSTLHAARMFLSVLGMIQHNYSDLRLFEFIANCIEVTTIYKQAASIPQAVEATMEKWRAISVGKESSDYQMALQVLLHQTRSQLTPQHTIIIFGDCRDWLGGWKDGYPLSAVVMEQLRQRVKQIYIFNPEPKESWNKGDSLVAFYQQVGAVVLEVLTLKQLAKHLEQLSRSR